MDPNKLKEAYQRLSALDERLTYKVRPRSSLAQPTMEQVDTRLKDLANYTVELKEVLNDVILAFAAKKKAKPPGE